MLESPIKVLIVDDEQTICDFLKRFLTLKGFSAQATQDGFQAIETVKQERFDIIFLDLRMPKIDGLETLRELKKITPEATFVVMTGYAMDETVQEVLKEGAVTAVKKPFEVSELAEKLRDIVAKKQESQRQN